MGGRSGQSMADDDREPPKSQGVSTTKPVICCITDEGGNRPAVPAWEAHASDYQLSDISAYKTFEVV